MTMKKGNLEDFIDYLETQVAHHSIYVWGGQGQTGNQVTEMWIRQREQDTGGTRINGKYKTYADIAVDYWKAQCDKGYHDVLSAYDCSGLVVRFLQLADIISADRSANGLRSLCDEANEPKKGYWVFRVSNNKATHVGVMFSDTEVIHAKGRAYGVVREKLDNTWNWFGKPQCFDFDEPSPKPEPTSPNYVHPKGNVRVREGNGTAFKQIKPTATKKDFLPYLGQADEYPNWYKVLWKGKEGYISSNPRYTEILTK